MHTNAQSPHASRHVVRERVVVLDVAAGAAVVLVVAIAGFLIAIPAAEAKPPSVAIKVIIAHLSDEPGKIDPRASRLHEELKGQFRYGGIKVLSTVTHHLAVHEIARDDLPSGRRLMVKPILIEGKSVLISVDVSGLVQTDMRLKSDQLVIIGAEKYRDGKLVIALEPHL